MKNPKPKAELFRILDAIFSKFIRLRDLGLGCVTCWQNLPWTCMQAGHYISRRYYPLRYDERNVHAQCKLCNEGKGGNEKKYKEVMIEMYGEEVVDEMEFRKNGQADFTTQQLEDMIAYYKGEVKSLKQSL